MGSKLVTIPSKSMIPERDIDKSPILECISLGIQFGGLKAEMCIRDRVSSACRVRRSI